MNAPAVRFTKALALSLILINESWAAEAAVTPPGSSVDEVLSARDSSDLIVRGAFQTIPEEEPQDGIGVPSNLLRMRFIVDRTYKGDTASGDSLIVYIPNEIVAYQGSNISRGMLFYLRQERTATAIEGLLEKYEYYENEFIEGRLSAAEMKIVDDEFAKAHVKISSGSSPISVMKSGPFEGEVERQVLIAENQDYIVSLIERNQSNENAYTLLPLYHGIYSGLDKIFAEKILSQPDSTAEAP